MTNLLINSGFGCKDSKIFGNSPFLSGNFYSHAETQRAQSFITHTDLTDLTDKDRSKGLGQRSKGYGVIHYSRLAL